MSPLSPLRLPVKTESGHKLGTVVDVIIDPQTQGVTAYHVKPSRLVPDAVQSPLIIHHSQVIEINEQAMIVDDAATRQAQASPAPLPTT